MVRPCTPTRPEGWGMAWCGRRGPCHLQAQRAVWAQCMRPLLPSLPLPPSCPPQDDKEEDKEAAKLRKMQQKAEAAAAHEAAAAQKRAAAAAAAAAAGGQGGRLFGRSKVAPDPGESCLWWGQVRAGILLQRAASLRFRVRSLLLRLTGCLTQGGQPLAAQPALPSPQAARQAAARCTLWCGRGARTRRVSVRWRAGMCGWCAQQFALAALAPVCASTACCDLRHELTPTNLAGLRCRHPRGGPPAHGQVQRLPRALAPQAGGRQHRCHG